VKRKLSREEIAARASQEIKDGDYVNLGIGIPNLCANYIKNKNVFLHAEQGLLGFGPLLKGDNLQAIDPDCVDAGGNLFLHKEGMACFDMDLSFDMIRGGYLDITMMGALEVSGKGDLANWTKSGTDVAGVGGSLDLAVGAKKVIICMEHTTKKGEMKVVKECKYPLTAKECVKMIVTDLAVLEIDKKGIILKEIAPGWSIDEIQSMTEPELIADNELREIEI